MITGYWRFVMMRGVVAVALAAVLVGFFPNRPAVAADILLGADVGDRVGVQIKKKSANPASQSIKLSVNDPDVVFIAGGGATDDPVLNGAAAVVFSATDCQCIVMGAAPGTLPGWTPSPRSGAATRYTWKDDATKSSASVAATKIKLKRKGGITYGLDATPQGEVEVQITFGDSPDRFCARFAAPVNASDDTATLYKSKVFATGTTACNAVPVDCAPCAPPIPTTTTTTTLAPCASATAPTCGGTCPSDQACTLPSGQNSCACVPACGSPQDGTCGGACPSGQACVLSCSLTSCGCSCTPTCYLSGAPTCGGMCPSGYVCGQAHSNGPACECTLPGPCTAPGTACGALGANCACDEHCGVSGTPLVCSVGVVAGQNGCTSDTQCVAGDICTGTSFTNNTCSTLSGGFCTAPCP